MAILNVQGSIDFTIVEQSEHRVVSEMPIGAGIINPFGVVHAGAILWLADVTATMLVMGSAKPSEGTPTRTVRASGAPPEGMKGFPLAISLNANFLGNQREGSLKAVATFVKRGRTVSVVRTAVYGAEEKLLADVTTSHVLSK